MATPLVRKVHADWLYHAMAILLVGAVMLHGISVTRDLDWPPGSDFFRDVAAAEAIKQSAGEAIQFKRLLADPNYRDEAFWYSPLTPGIVATLSAITGAPAHIVDARAGAYLNAATPLTFYALMVSMFGAGPALLSLVAFLFLQPYPSWLQATYSPWLVVSNFAQAAFYTTLLVWRRFLRTNTGSAAALTGLSLGVTLLAHTAPAAMLGVIFSVSVISLLIAPLQGLSRARIIGLSGTIVGIALLVSAPVWATVAHYHGQVRNLLPFVWIEPDLGPERIRTWLEGNLARPVLNIGIVAGIGLVWGTRDFRLSRSNCWPHGSSAQ